MINRFTRFCFVVFLAFLFQGAFANSSEVDSIYFYGFGYQPVKEVCQKQEGQDNYLYITRIYKHIVSTQEVYDCRHVLSGFGTSSELFGACENIAQKILAEGDKENLQFKDVNINIDVGYANANSMLWEFPDLSPIIDKIPDCDQG